MNSIILDKVSKSYKINDYVIKAIDEIDLSVKSGELLAIVGPSGSGKSTLLNVMGLIYPLDSGKILIDGEDVTGYSDNKLCLLRNSLFGYIFQEFALVEDDSAYENIRIPLLYNKKYSSREHKHRISFITQQLNIQDKLYRNIAQLSGGEKQKVAIARAIVCDQPVILADEPTSSLDANNREMILDILIKLCKEKGKTVVMATHDKDVAEKCDRVINLKDGKICL